MHARTPGGPLALAGLTTFTALAAMAGPPALAATQRDEPQARIAVPRLSDTPPSNGGTAFGDPTVRKPKVVAPRAHGVFPIAGPKRRIDFGTHINRFGNDRGDHSHGGQDIFAPAGTPLRAVSDATVLDHGSDGGRGNWIALYSRQAKRTFLYFHMQAPTRLKPGQNVSTGRRVGRVGCTGSCSGDHLHFEIHRGRSVSGAAIDPMPSLRRWQKPAKRK